MLVFAYLKDTVLRPKKVNSMFLGHIFFLEMMRVGSFLFFELNAIKRCIRVISGKTNKMATNDGRPRQFGDV